MKNACITIIILIAYQSITFAQQKFSFNIYAGTNISKLKPKELTKNAAYPFANTYKWTASYNFGANADMFLSSKIYVESGINFISKKSNAQTKEIKSFNIGYFNGASIDYYDKHYYTDFNQQSLAFQIPLSLHLIVLKKENVNVNIYLGILYENMFSHSLNLNNYATWTPQTPSKEVLKNMETYEQKYGGFPTSYGDDSAFIKNNIGGLGGIGFSYRKFGLDLGLNNPIRAYTSVQYRNPSITLNLRYKLI